MEIVLILILGVAFLMLRQMRKSNMLKAAQIIVEKHRDDEQRNHDNEQRQNDWDKKQNEIEDRSEARRTWGRRIKEASIISSNLQDFMFERGRDQLFWAWCDSGMHPEFAKTDLGMTILEKWVTMVSVVHEDGDNYPASDAKRIHALPPEVQRELGVPEWVRMDYHPLQGIPVDFLMHYRPEEDIQDS